MTSRNRFNSGGRPLLRTIVDRSSFDEEELAMRRNTKNGQSLRRAREVVVNSNWSDDESSSSLGSRDSGVVMRNGKVRRKLRWKPPGMRSRRKNKNHTPAVDASSNASVMSHHTKASNKSFHTFHSTETPVQSNKASANASNRTKLFHRPNYPDTFDPGAVSTIDNEGTFIRTRMQTLHRDDQEDTELRCMSLPSSRSNISFDFNPIMEEDGEQPALEPARPIEEPVAVVKRPPRSKKPVKKLVLEDESPRRSPDNSNSSVATPSTTASTKSSFSPTSPLLNDDDSVLPMLNPDDYEEGRRLDLLMGMNPGDQYSYSDANSMTGFRPSHSQQQHKTNVPSPRSVVTHHHARRMLSVDLVPDRLLSMPMTPDRPPRFPSTASISPSLSSISPSYITPQGPSQISIISSCPVPAKVAHLDLHGPSNLATMIHSSALLFGQDYLPDMPLVREFTRTTASKAYHRPVDMTEMSPPPGQLVSDDNMSLPGVAPDEILIVSTDGDIQPTAGMVVHHGSRTSYPTEIESVSSSFSSRSTSSRQSPSGKHKQVTPRHSRTTTGPVDVDNGVFLEAEHNLRAIHAMAAEHLAHGEYVEALEVFEEILRGQQERYGPNHYRVGTALHNIAIVHLKSKRYDVAIRAARHAIRVRKESLVPNHPDVAVSLALLGVACLESRRYRDALASFREALYIRKTTLGPKNFRVARTLNNIGCTLFEMGELENGKLAFEEALEIQRDSLRSSPSLVEPEISNSLPSNQILLSMASTLCNIASIKLRMRKSDDATLSLEEALLIQQSVLGDDHPTVLNTIESIEYIEQSKGDFVLPSAQELISKWIDPDPERPCEEKPLSKVMTDAERWSSNMCQFLRQSKTRLLSDIGDNIGSTCGSEIPNDEVEVASVADFVGDRAEI